ncbi:hypothetical protein [Burkholderia anthina]|uniref:hypothetical protein n=1 Tax=Burkholderia anthina TaxID=179879 RepID=UPI00158EAD84|nr:hypothetical protein [Burkholderia anthina]
MKHRNDIRFATASPALRRAARAPCAHAGTATTLSAVTRRRLSLQFVVPFVTVPGAFAIAIAAQPAVPPTLSRARRRPFSSVRLTLMQDHSS